MAVAVICEFNPFHNGHRYLLKRVSDITGKPLIAVMSGSFTQRGEIAVCSKWERARAALENGADLVAELPTVYAVANAERFARGGVDIAKAFSDVDTLAFGCETDDTEALTAACQATELDEVNALVAEQMKCGAYYPKALESAVREVCGDKAADVLTSPNNILAVEYIRALKDSGIKPLPVKRVGVSHDSEALSGEFASASQLRKMLRAGESIEAFAPYVPEKITYPELMERAILFKLRSMDIEGFRALPDVSEGLEHRLVNAIGENNSVKEILSAVKTKRYTHARLRRIITCAALGITEEQQAQKAHYARILGFTERGEQLLKSCAFEVVTSLAKALRSGSENSGFLRTDILASDLAALAYKEIEHCGTDYLTKIIRENRAK